MGNQLNARQRQIYLRKIKESSSPVSKTPASPAKPEEFHPLDFAFERKEDWNGLSPHRLQAIMAYAWYGDNDRYWRKKGNLTSEERLARAIASMDNQTSADQKAPGWMTLVLPGDPDPDCQLCGGEGATLEPNDAYSGDNPYLMAVPCSCLGPSDLKPWRKEYRDDD
jgi:hypothetical protein